MTTASGQWMNVKQRSLQVGTIISSYSIINPLMLLWGSELLKQMTGMCVDG